jgi:hypothetical protein
MQLMTQAEFDSNVQCILNDPGGEGPDAAMRLSSQCTAEHIPQLTALTFHKNEYVGGAPLLPHLLEVSARLMALGLDCDSLQHEIIEVVLMAPEAALRILKPFVLNRAEPLRINGMWAISHIESDESRGLLNSIMRDPTESEKVRSKVAYYLGHKTD